MTIEQVSQLQPGTWIRFPDDQQAEVTAIDEQEKMITLVYEAAVTPDPYAPFQAMRAFVESGPIGPEYNPTLPPIQKTKSIARWRDVVTGIRET